MQSSRVVLVSSLLLSLAVAAGCEGGGGQPEDFHVSLTKTPAHLTNAAAASFSFKSDDAKATFKCKLDDADEEDCKSPAALADLVDGEHTFTVLAYLEGYDDPATAEYTWTVDTTKPDTTATPPADLGAQSTDVVFEFTSSEDNSTFRCQLDSAAETDCVSGVRYSGLPNGEHTFAVYAIDRAGNKDEQPATVSWTIDVSGPVVTITAGPETGSISAPAGQFTYVCPETGVTFKCTLDGFEVACSESGYTFGGLTHGMHAFRVRAFDALENEGPTTERVWLVDAQGPDSPTVVTPGAAPYLSGDTQITIGGACETGAVVTLYDATTAATELTTCVAMAYSFNVTKNTNGTFQFVLVQTDALGNSSGETSWSWNRDTDLPASPTVTTPAVATTISSGNGLSIAGGCTAGLLVTLGGAGDATALCSGGGMYQFNVSKASDGTYDYTVKQTSLTGFDSGTVGVRWVRDTAKPSAPAITSPATSPYLSTETTFNLSGTCEEEATVAVKDGGATLGSATCTGGVYSFPISKGADGTYTFSVTQTDHAANASGAANLQWTRSTVVAAPTYTMLKNNIFIARCSGCHSGDAPSAGLNLLTYASTAARTAPGNATGSTLYLRVTTVGPIMPRGGTALSDADKSAIAAWINAGANDN